MDHWTNAIALTRTLTLENEKGDFFYLNLCLNHILKWMMMCEASVGVSVQTVTVLIGGYFLVRMNGWRKNVFVCIIVKFVEFYNVVCRLLTCSDICFDQACLYNIVWHMLQGHLNWIS